MTMVTSSFASNGAFYVDVGKDMTAARLLAEEGGDLFVVSSSVDSGTIQRVTRLGVGRWKAPVEFQVRDATIGHGVILVCGIKAFRAGAFAAYDMNGNPLFKGQLQPPAGNGAFLSCLATDDGFVLAGDEPSLSVQPFPLWTVHISRTGVILDSHVYSHAVGVAGRLYPWGDQLLYVDYGDDGVGPPGHTYLLSTRGEFSSEAAAPAPVLRWAPGADHSIAEGRLIGYFGHDVAKAYSWSGSSWVDQGTLRNYPRFGISAALRAPSGNLLFFGGHDIRNVAFPSILECGNDLVCESPRDIESDNYSSITINDALPHLINGVRWAVRFRTQFGHNGAVVFPAGGK